MKKKLEFALRIVISAVALLATAGAGDAVSQSQPVTTGDPMAGRQIFEQRGCQRCHSIWGNGGTLGPDLATVGAGRSLQQLAGMFWNHTPRMIETFGTQGYQWVTFTEQEMANVISYIYYVKLFDEPGDSEEGERLFRNKRCVECHSLGAEGGDEGPALDSLAQYLTPVALAAEMWNHGGKMRRRQVELGIAMPIFAGRDVANIQAYIRAASALRNRQTEFLPPPDPAHGRRLFAERRCVVCHGAGGEGSRVAPNLRDVTGRLSASAIAGEMWNHSLLMNATMESRGVRFPRFEGSEMADVISFLYYLNFYDDNGDPVIGELNFFRKGCSQCHSLNGGESIGPDLSLSTNTATALSLATAMWNHAPSMYSHTQTAGVTWPRFEGDEMRDLAAFLAVHADGTGSR